jgi:lactoylglutathione lyase
MTSGATAQVETNVEKAVPFFWVRDIRKSLDFYVDGLGFKITNQWIDEGTLRWCWLELGTAAMMLQEYSPERPPRNVTDHVVGAGVSICFTCKDALTIYRELKARGVVAKRPFVGNSMWVTEVTDPDGYHLLFESPTDVAEETEYSE